jgi:cation:H+ antiporter
MLFGLFWAQFVIGVIVPDSFGGRELLIVGAAYLVLGLWTFVRDRELIAPLLRDGFRTPYAELASIQRRGGIETGRHAPSARNPTA